MNENIALSLDELERIPAWVPALTRAGYSFEQDRQTGVVTGWDVIVPVDQQTARDVAKLKGLTVFVRVGGAWRPKG